MNTPKGTQKRSWNWNHLKIKYLEGKSKLDKQPSMVFIHGFGACKEHWRHNLVELNKSFNVYALDLVGFGESEKPRSRLKDEPEIENSFCYGISEWATQVITFIQQCVADSEIILVGNSIGGVVACEAARQLENKGKMAQRLILIDCAQRQIDDKRLSEQPPFRRLGKPLLKKLVRQRWITRTLYKSLAKPSVIKKVLKIAYPSGSNVDKELVNFLYSATQDKNADEAFRGFINLFDDLLAPDILKQLQTPTSLIWGEKDPWEPVEEAKKWGLYDCVEQIKTLENLGHCPHDENPELINNLILSLNKN
jgi:pimeloyl-ACP methyl ester carboxylesterase